MTMKELFYLSCLMILILGNKCNENAGEYFNRPVMNECIALEELGKKACNGKIFEIQAGDILPMTNADYENARKYFLDKEQFAFECAKFGRCDY